MFLKRLDQISEVIVLPKQPWSQAAQTVGDGQLLVKVWNNSDAAFVDGRAFTLIAF